LLHLIAHIDTYALGSTPLTRDRSVA